MISWRSRIAPPGLAFAADSVAWYSRVVFCGSCAAAN